MSLRGPVGQEIFHVIYHLNINTWEENYADAAGVLLKTDNLIIGNIEYRVRC